MSKRIFKYVMLLVMLVSFTLPLTSCVVSTPQNQRENRHYKRPPGHQKKLYGDRSAKRYAPGQQKKKHNSKPQKKSGNHKGGHKGKKQQPGHRR